MEEKKRKEHSEEDKLPPKRRKITLSEFLSRKCSRKYIPEIVQECEKAAEDPSHTYPFILWEKDVPCEREVFEKTGLIIGHFVDGTRIYWSHPRKTSQHEIVDRIRAKYDRVHNKNPVIQADAIAEFCKKAIERDQFSVRLPKDTSSETLKILESKDFEIGYCACDCLKDGKPVKSSWWECVPKFVEVDDE